MNYENNSGRNAVMSACLAGKCFNIWNVLGSPLVFDIVLFTFFRLFFYETRSSFVLKTFYSLIFSLLFVYLFICLFVYVFIL